MQSRLWVTSTDLCLRVVSKDQGIQMQELRVNQSGEPEKYVVVSSYRFTFNVRLFLFHKQMKINCVVVYHSGEMQIVVSLIMHKMEQIKPCN